MENVYAIVEMMGHRRYGAKVSEVERFGVKFMRAEVLTDPPHEQLVHPQSIYAVTTCTEEQARAACRYAESPAAIRALPSPVDVSYRPDDELFDSGEADEGDGEGDDEPL